MDAIDQEIKYLGDVQRLKLEEGDVVVIITNNLLSAELHNKLTTVAQSFFAKNKVLVLDAGMKIGVIGGRDKKDDADGL